MLSIKPNLFLLVTESSYFSMKLLGVTRTKKDGWKTKIKTLFVVLYISILRSELKVSGQLQFVLQSRPGTHGKICMDEKKIRELQELTRGLWGHVSKGFLKLSRFPWDI